MTTEQRVRTMREVGTTVLLATPTYALRMAERSRELGIDVASSGIRVTIHAGEPGASIPSTRAAIEDAYQATSFDHTGMTELGPTGHSCSQRDGIHLIESEFIFEVLDRHGRPADEGELVATNLGRWGSPLIRYRTGDRVQVTREECSCGSPFVKVVGGIRGRIDDMFTVRGVNLFPSQVEDIVRRHAGVAEFFDPLDAFGGCAGYRKTVNEVIVHEIGIDAVFHGLHHVEARHEFFDAFQFFERHGFEGEAEVMMGAVGDAIAHDAPRFVAVAADTKHACSDDCDSGFLAASFTGPFTYSFFRPAENV